jgi:acid phosphatase (class A)
MGWRTSIATAGALAALAWVAAAPAAPPQGYLLPGAAPYMISVLPPPPARGSGVEADDRRAFEVTRKLKGSARWTLATADAAVSPQADIHDFACALGVVLDETSAPTLYGIFSRSLSDERAFITPPKDFYQRPRPFVGRRGDICVARTDELARSGSYPSGHSTAIWAWGLMLAELAPDRATAILTRARVYSESRVVCGVHFPSDIAAGRLNGSALYAALQSSPAFRADMEKARAEIAAARAAGGPSPDPALCKVEAEAAAHRPW